MDLVAFLTLVAGVGSLFWAVHSRLRDRLTPQWSLGVPNRFFLSNPKAEATGRSLAFRFVAGDFGKMRLGSEFEFFMLYCEGSVSGSRVRFGISEGFELVVMRIKEGGILEDPLSLRHSHYTRVDPGERFLLGVVAPEGKSVESGFLYVRWQRMITGADRDDVRALCFNLGRDEKLSWAGRRAIRRTMASPDKVFLPRS